MDTAPAAFLPHTTILRRLQPPRAFQSIRFTRIGLVGNFPLRRCGLATFTADIRDALAGAVDDLQIDVVAISGVF
jgi:hypothetical protein